jgi:uncharacterized protein YndB with AHSA1/START domain
MSFVIDRRLEIEAPAPVVWKVLTDLDAYGQWNPFVPECRSTLRPGDRIAMRVKLGKRTSRQVEEMLSFDEGRGFSYRMRPLPFGALSSLRVQRIEALDDGRCEYHTHFELQGWLMPLVRKLLGRQLDVGFSGMTQGLKRRSEQVWANATPTP